MTDQEVVKAKAFELVDDEGNVCAALRVLSDGTSALRLGRPGKTARAQLAVLPDGTPALTLYDGDKKPALTLTLDEQDKPVALLKDGRTIPLPE